MTRKKATKKPGKPKHIFSEEVGTLRVGIQKIIQGAQKEGLKELSAKFDKKFDKKIGELRKELEKPLGEDRMEILYDELMKMHNEFRQGVREIKQWRDEVQSMKKDFEGDASLGGGVKKKLSHMDRNIKEILAESERERERLEADITEVKQLLRELADVRNQMKSLDIAGLRRDLESVRTKQEWLEKSLDGFDLEPLKERLKELEHKLSMMRVSSPLVIE